MSSGFIFDGVSKPIDVSTADVDDILAHFGGERAGGQHKAGGPGAASGPVYGHGSEEGAVSGLAAVAADMRRSSSLPAVAPPEPLSMSDPSAALPSVPAASPTSAEERVRRPLAAADADAEGNEFWTEVEGFLSRPAPRVGKMASAPTLAASMSLPTLKQERAQLRKALTGGGPPAIPRASGSGVAALRPSPVASASSSASSASYIDPSLLQQAFQYNAGAVSDDEAPLRSSSAPSSGPRRRKSTGIVKSGSHRRKQNTPSGGGPVAVGGGAAAARARRPPSGGVRRRRPPKSADAAESAYSKPLRRKSGAAGRKGKSRPKFASGHGGKGAPTKDGSLSKEHMDKLVERFELGLGVEDLKRQLAESQERMAQSKSVITEAANEFYGAGP